MAAKTHNALDTSGGELEQRVDEARSNALESVEYYRGAWQVRHQKRTLLQSGKLYHELQLEVTNL